MDPVDGYDSPYGDFVLAGADVRRNAALWSSLQAEGLPARVEFFVEFARRELGCPIELDTRAPALLDAWLATADIDVRPAELSQSGWQLGPGWRGFTVDAAFTLCEIAQRTVAPLGEWRFVVDTFAKRKRGAPKFFSPGDDPQAPFIEMMSAGITGLAVTRGGRRFIGPVPKSAPFGYLYDLVSESQERSARAVRRGVRAKRRRPLPTMPAAHRAAMLQAQEDGSAGDFGTVFVLDAANAAEAKRYVVQDEPGFIDQYGHPPSERLRAFVDDLYRSWPHVEEDLEISSPYEFDLRDTLHGRRLEVIPSRAAPAGLLYAAICDHVRSHGLIGYHEDEIIQ